MSALSGCDPELAKPGYALILEVERAGLQARVTSTRRSHGKQAELYRAYMAGNSPLPAAPPGQSAHEYGYAFDMVVSPAEYQGDVGALWESWGGAWGGVADPVHFELPGASAWARSQPALVPGCGRPTIYNLASCTPEEIDAAVRAGALEGYGWLASAVPWLL